jgi:Ca-activated chloride channel family protein
VYTENAREDTATLVRELLVKESLAAGVPCSETSFVAVRSEVGQVVTETRIVANALPHGWSADLTLGGSARMACASLSLSAPSPAPAEAGPVDSMLAEFDDEDFDDDDSDTATDHKVKRKDVPKARSRAASSPLSPAKPGLFSRAAKAIGNALGGAPPRALKSDAEVPTGDIRVSIAAGKHAPADGAVLFDSASGGAGQFTFLSVAFADKGITADAIDSELTLLLFVGDLAAPRARVKLVDVLRQGGRRPLNIRRDANQAVRLVLADPSGAWKAGIPAMEIVLGTV